MTEPSRPKREFMDSLICSTASGLMEPALDVICPIIASTGSFGMSLGTKKTVVTPIKITSRNVAILERRNLPNFIRCLLMIGVVTNYFAASIFVV